MKGTENFAGQDAKLEIEQETKSNRNLTKTSFLYAVDVRFVPWNLGLRWRGLIGKKSEVLLVNCFHARKGTQGSKKLTKNGSFAGSNYRSVSLLTDASFMVVIHLPPLVYNFYNPPNV